MKGSRIPEHWMVIFEPREARVIQLVLKDVLHLNEHDSFNLNEYEEEVVADAVRVIGDE